MSLKAAIAGASGYAGGEVARLLAAHLEIETTTLTTASSTGRLSGELHPQIGSLTELEIQEISVEALPGHDLMILVLSRGHPTAFAEEFDAGGDGALVLDCVTDRHLIEAEDWAEYYGREFSPAWTYDMPELIHAREPLARAQRELLAATRRAAVPGCNATAVTLALQPAMHAGLVDVSHVVATLAVGYSGADKSMRPHLLASQALGSMAPYVVGEAHRRIPEITQNLVLAGEGKESMRLSFTPVLVPTSRGILTTVVAPLVEGVKKENVEETYIIYENETLITVTPDGVWPTSGPVTGTGLAQVKTVIDAKVGTLITIAVIDNLEKGTAAAAIQSANTALGSEGYLGVPVIEVAP